MTTRPLMYIVPVLLLALIAGCAKTDYTIPLVYQQLGVAANACKGKQIALVRFADGRKRTEIGDKDREVIFYPEGKSVTEWVTRAIQDELAGAGCLVQYHETYYPFNVDYVVTGEVMNVYLRQTGYLDFDVEMKVKIKLMQGQDTVAEKDYSALAQKKVLPMEAKKEAILMATLQDLLRDAVPDLMSKIR